MFTKLFKMLSILTSCIELFSKQNTTSTQYRLSRYIVLFNR